MPPRRGNEGNNRRRGNGRRPGGSAERGSNVQMYYTDFYRLVEANNLAAFHVNERGGDYRSVTQQEDYLKRAFIKGGMDKEEVNDAVDSVIDILNRVGDTNVNSEKRDIRKEALERVREIIEEHTLMIERGGKRPAAERGPNVLPPIPDQAQELSLEDFKKHLIFLRGKNLEADVTYEESALLGRFNDRVNMVRKPLRRLNFVDQNGLFTEEAKNKVADQTQIEFYETFQIEISQIANVIADAVQDRDPDSLAEAHKKWCDFFELTDDALNFTRQVEIDFAPNIGDERWNGEPYVKDWTDRDQVNKYIEFHQTYRDFLQNNFKANFSDELKEGTHVYDLLATANTKLQKVREYEPSRINTPAIKAEIEQVRTMLKQVDTEYARLQGATEATEKEKEEEQTRFEEAVQSIEDDYGQKGVTIEVDANTKIGAIYHYMRGLRQQVAAATREIGVSAVGEEAKKMSDEELKGLRVFRTHYRNLAKKLNDKRFDSEKDRHKELSDDDIRIVKKHLSNLQEAAKKVFKDVVNKKEELQAKAASDEAFDQSAAASEHFVESLYVGANQGLGIPGENDFVQFTEDPSTETEITEEKDTPLNLGEAGSIYKEKKAEAERLESLKEEKMFGEIVDRADNHITKKLDSILPGEPGTNKFVTNGEGKIIIGKGAFFEEKKKRGGFFSRRTSIAETNAKTFVETAEPENVIVKWIKDLETKTGVAYDQDNRTVFEFLRDAVVSDLMKSDYQSVSQREKVLKRQTDDFKAIKVSE